MGLDTAKEGLATMAPPPPPPRDRSKKRAAPPGPPLEGTRKSARSSGIIQSPEEIEHIRIVSRLAVSVRACCDRRWDPGFLTAER